MSENTKSCRVCGKPYEACRNAQRASGAFFWREVACSQECGATYLARIMDDRASDVAGEPSNVSLPKVQDAQEAPVETTLEKTLASDALEDNLEMLNALDRMEYGVDEAATLSVDDGLDSLNCEADAGVIAKTTKSEKTKFHFGGGR